MAFISFCSYASGWSGYAKRISGTPSPVVNVRPYTIMTQQLNGSWQYSCYYIPGQTVTFKFLVNTNMINTNFLYELREPREITVSLGTQGRMYYLTNTPAGLIRVTEGTGVNAVMQLEFNWEDSPDAPTGLYADNVDNRACTIHWSPSLEMDVTGYNVYVSNQYYPYYKKANREALTNHSFTLTNLVFGSTNTIYVTSLDAYTNMPNHESSPSSVIQVISDRYVAVLFYLKKSRQEVSDSVYLCGDQSPLDWNFSRKMSYLYNDIWYDKALYINNTQLQYKFNLNKDSSQYEGQFSTASGNREVMVTDPDGDGIMVLNDVWGVLTVNNPAPAAPADVTAIPANAGVFLYWSRNKEADLKEYKIYRGMNNTNDLALIRETTLTNFSDTGLVNNTNYYYKVTASDIEKNESGYSRLISVIPSTNPRPIVPSGLSALPGNTNVKLNWNRNPEQDIEGYVVWRSIQKYSLYSNISGLVTNVNYNDQAVLNDLYTYYYKIQAVDLIRQTNLGYSEIVSAAPSTNPAPMKPSGLEVVLTGDQCVFIRWILGPDPDLARYAVYYKKENGVIDSVSAGQDDHTNFLVSGLENGEKYKLWIEAVDSSDNRSEESDPVYAYPVPVITDLSLKPSGTETGAVVLNFTSPAKAGTLGYPKRYIIKYSSDPVSDFNGFQQAGIFADIRASISGTSESIKVNNLGTDCPGYYFTVMAVYGDDQGKGMSSSRYAVAGQVFSYGLGGTFRKKGERVQMVIPAQAVPSESTAVVIKTWQDLVKENNAGLPVFETANEKARAFSGVRLMEQNTNNVFDLVLIHSGGEEIGDKKNFNKKVTVSIPFRDTDHDLIVDGTTGADKVRVKTLKMYWLNEDRKEWALVEDSSADLVNNFIVAGISHLTMFVNMATLASLDLSNVAVYPNPSYDPSDSNRIVFTRLTEKTRIRIYNVAGELVKKGLAGDSTGKCFWDGMNDSNKPVASGLYIYYAEDGASEPARGKLAIIR
ncbi:MAG: hypothetical protein PHF84_02450 [bacterium]|nr:hypothetical protein [bacterium]